MLGTDALAINGKALPFVDTDTGLLDIRQK
jgi:hypothetical protein